MEGEGRGRREGAGFHEEEEVRRAHLTFDGLNRQAIVVRCPTVATSTDDNTTVEVRGLWSNVVPQRRAFTGFMIFLADRWATLGTNESCALMPAKAVGDSVEVFSREPAFAEMGRVPERSRCRRLPSARVGAGVHSLSSLGLAEAAFYLIIFEEETHYFLGGVEARSDER